jgi:predicted porin
MKTTIKLAVASALVAAASSANAGIIIPAGDWTLDIGGVVNAYYTHTRFSGDNGAGSTPLGLGAGDADNSANITTGLLPNYLTVSGKTRQNDLDVGFTISMNPGSSSTRSGIQDNGGADGGRSENRQAFLTFGDKSWGSIKLGKDLGIYASDAILNSQVAYSSPNWNGFSFTVGLTQAWNATDSGVLSTTTNSARAKGQTAYEGKASYEWAGDVSGKVWASAITQKVEDIDAMSHASAIRDGRATAWDIGANVNVAGFGLTGYYGQGKGIGQTFQLMDGFDHNGKRRDSDQWYVQGTYTLPGVGTKLGVSYGESTLDGNNLNDEHGFRDLEDSMWTVGAYHPLTKHLNLVAEYSETERQLKWAGSPTEEAKAKTVSLGAILFF